VKILAVVVWFLATVLPVVGYLALLPRSERRHGKLRVVVGTLALGAALYVPAKLIEHLLETWTGLQPRGGGASDLTGLAYLFLVVAPLEQGLKVAAIAPVWRSRHFHEAFDGIVYASAAALGFVTAHNATFLWGRALGFDLARALLAVPAHLFFAAVWGYALARDPRKRLGGRLFNVAWLVAMAFNGVYDHIVFGRGKAALVAVVPVLLCMGGLSWAAARDLSQRNQRGSFAPRTRRSSIAPPSLGAMREALLRTERPVMLTWIAFGALVQAGVMTAALAAAVALGHRVGLDFSAVDRGESSVASAAPLVLLGGAALAAFPMAGYLVARASSTRTVLEPAMSAALAIAGFLVLLGLAAPVAVVFAIAFAPVAFGLACGGAWVGLR
jgi:RsiW-degrading membrane proteinase PrsW (M82 family)